MWITNKNSHWTQPQNKLGLWVTWVDRDASSDNDVQCDLDQRFTRNAAFLKITLLDSMKIFVYVFRSSKSWVALDVKVWRFFEAFEGGVAEDDGLVLAPEPVCHDQLRHLILVVAICVAWNQKNIIFISNSKVKQKQAWRYHPYLHFSLKFLGHWKQVWLKTLKNVGKDILVLALAYTTWCYTYEVKSLGLPMWAFMSRVRTFALHVCGYYSNYVTRLSQSSHICNS